MTTGRRPKPTALHLANGNPSKKRINAREPRPLGEVKPPPWVDGDTVKVWKAVVPLLEGMGVMTAADCEAVARYCDGIVLWQRARRFLHERGSTYPIRS